MPPFLASLTLALCPSVALQTPFQYEAELVRPPEVAPGTVFGDSFSVDGEWMAVGDRGGSDGSVSFYKRTSQGWGLRQIERGEFHSGFGDEIIVRGSVCVVGASTWDWFGTRTGKAYIYELEGDHWSLTQELHPDGLNYYDKFGSWVALSPDGNVIAVSARGDAGQETGLVWIYERTGTTWALSQLLDHPPDTGGIRQALALTQDTLVVGNSAVDAAFVYRRTSTGWLLEATLQDPTPPQSSFAYDVAVDGDTIVVGQTNKGLPGSLYGWGRANIYDRGPTGIWSITQELQASDGWGGEDQGGDEFGESVDIDGDRIIVSAPGNNVFGNHYTPNGELYIFSKTGPPSAPWEETLRLAPTGNQGEALGEVVAIQGDFAFGSTPYYGPWENHGGVFVYDLREIGSSYCPGIANSTGLPAELTMSGSPVLGHVDLGFSVNHCPPNTLGILLTSLTTQQVGLGDGLLCLGSPFHRTTAPLQVGPTGVAYGSIDLGNPTIAALLQPGLTWHFQFGHRDPDGFFYGFNFTNGVALPLE